MGATARLAAAALLVAGSYVGVRTGAARRIDALATRALTGPVPPAVDRVVGAATDLGSVYGLAGVAGALALAGRRRLASDVAVGGALAWTLAQAAKPALHRPRPYEDGGGAQRLVAEPAGSSWPSGHAAVMASMASVLWPHGGRGARLAVLAATGAVAVSRLQVGVHHASDVVAGAGVGLLASECGRRLRRR